MCKAKRDRAVYLESSRRSNESNSILRPLAAEAEVKEWEDARCPVCMEHPHNALLLICSSYNKGFRPYMCNTSQRHSNCLGQYRKTFAKPLVPTPPREGAPIAHWSSITGSWEEGEAPAPSIFPHMHKLKEELACPLCRGEISGWIVVRSAREFMNSKTRSCACETCDYSGNYGDLRQHARVEHPEVRPTDPNPERQNNWRQLEMQRDVDDLMSNFRSLREPTYVRVDTGDSSSTTIFLVLEVTNYRMQTQEIAASEGSRSVSVLRRSRNYMRVVSDGEEEDESFSSVEDDDEAPRSLGYSRIRFGDRRIRRRLTRLE